MLTRRTRPAFTLAEVVITITLIAILAAVLIPTMRGRLQDGYEDALVQELDNIASAVTAYRQDVGHYPPKLSYLSALPGSPVDHCGNALSATAVASYGGPYVTRTIVSQAGTTGYIAASKDTILDTLITTATPAGLAVTLTGPDLATAKSLDLRFDGVAGTAAGSLQYTIPVASANVKYIVPTKSGAC
jgi:prepilin-type N-terminal cleavage/methylation domain-containing protein